MNRHLYCLQVLITATAVAGCGEIVDDGGSADRDCGALDAPANGSVATPMTTFGATATYSCDTGYTLVGSAARSCLDDGAWSGAEPTCRLVDCGDLTAPTNGAITLTETTAGATATYDCDAGFSLDGEPTRACGDDGAWSGEAPSCVLGCSCFAASQLDDIETDIASGGSPICVVDSEGGGTTISAFISSWTNRRYVASALYNASLPGTQFACEFGCLDDTPGNGVDDCAGLPTFQQTQSISQEDHDACRAMIMQRCSPISP